MYIEPIRPTTEPVAVQQRGDKTYHLFANGQLWTTGEYGPKSLKYEFLCGYVSHPDHLDEAIDNHEEELRVLIAQARAEFGL